MSLRRLQVADFRCLASLEIELGQRLTLITGPNASGKTSVLEAIYILGRGRSFRSPRIENLVRQGSLMFRVHGETTGVGGSHSVGVEGGQGAMRARIDSRSAKSLAELAMELRIQAIDPEVHQLIEEGPSRRRRFIDWGVFHVEHSHVHSWRAFSQALRQRNAALKARMPKAVCDVWDTELSRYGSQVSDARERYVAALAPFVAQLSDELIGATATLRFKRGWPVGETLTDALARNWSIDRDRGSTQSGPHRAELAIEIGGVIAKDRVSRGQQKLLASALLLAQLKLLAAHDHPDSVLLLDDPAAELDRVRFEKLLGAIHGVSTQLVVTALDATMGAFGRPERHIELEQGSAKCS